MKAKLYWALAVAASRVKGRSYPIDSRLPLSGALGFMWWKAVEATRAMLRLRQTHVSFLGKDVVLRARSCLRVGRGTVIGDFARIDALSVEGVVLRDGTSIGEYTVIRATGVLGSLGVGFDLGRNSSIGAFGFVGAAGGVKIGENVIAGQRVSFHAENHVFDNLDRPIREQGVTREGITVGDDCWIGAGTIFLDGVHVGSGCVIAAGAVLIRGDYPSNSIIGGVPARVLKSREQVRRHD